MDEENKKFTLGGKEFHEGDPISLDGSTGNIYDGIIPTVDATIAGEFGRIMGWADKYKKIENDVYNFPTWQYCKYKDIFDSRIIINSTAKFYISISYQKDLLSIDTRIFTPSFNLY